MRFLKTNTATRITVGPFFDKTDGVTPETALTVTSCKLTFTVDDGGVPTLVLDTNPTASGGSNDMVHITGDDAGFYDLELTAANVNYVGRAMLAITDAATHCPVFHEFMILPANVYDSLVGGSDTLQADVTQFGGTNGTFSGGRPEVNTTHAAGTAWGSGAITAASIANGAIDAATFAADVDAEVYSWFGLTANGATNFATYFNSDGQASDREVYAAPDQLMLAKFFALALRKDSQVAADLATQLNLINSNFATGAGAYDNTTDSGQAVRDRGDVAWITSTLTVGGIADAVWDEDATTHQTQGTFGQAIGDPGADTDSIWALANTNLNATVSSRASQTSVDDIPTNAELTTALANLDAAVSTRATPAQVATELATYDGPTNAEMEARTLVAASYATASALSTVQNDLTQIKADLPTRPTKNTALANFPFVMRLSSDHVTGATGKTVTATRSLDGAAFGACANSVSEVANGVYKISLAAGDLNADTVTLRFTATDCDDTIIVIATQP